MGRLCAVSVDEMEAVSSASPSTSPSIVATSYIASSSFCLVSWLDEKEG